MANYTEGDYLGQDSTEYLVRYILSRLIEVTSYLDVLADSPMAPQSAAVKSITDSLQQNLGTLAQSLKSTSDEVVEARGNYSDLYKRLDSVDTLLSAKQDALTFDNAPTEFSDNPVTSGGVYTALGSKQATLTFDNAPTASSRNPVTSDGIYTALGLKQDNLTFDAEPTESSLNPVTSSGIKSALDLKQDVLTLDTEPAEDSSNPITSGGVYTALAAIREELFGVSALIGPGVNP